MPRKFLYRRSGLAVIVILGLLALVAPPAAKPQGRPQLKRPQETTEEKLPEEKKPKKNVKGPRAVGVLQLTKDGKATLIPIAILIDGKFHDASVYKADPVPMALDSGTVYEAEQAGDSQGLFTVAGALHSSNPGSPHPWVGAGSYLPRGTEAPKATRKAEDVPVGMDSSGSDERPRLSRGKTSAASSPSPESGSSTPVAAGSSQKPVPPGSSGSSQPASGTSAGGDAGGGLPAGGSSGHDAPKPAAPPVSDKPSVSDKTTDQGVKPSAPTLAQKSAGQSAPAQTSPAPASQAPESKAPAAQGQASPAQTSSAQSPENYYRPTLRRGKPEQSAPQDEEPALTEPKTDKAQADGSTTGKPGSAGAVSEPVQLVPAISDAGGPDPQPYKFYWKAGEEEERRNQMLALAADEVMAYANTLAKNRIPAKPPAAAKTTSAAGHKPPAKPALPMLENVQFRAFDVWVNNQPVMILSAEAHFPPARGATTVPEQYSITLVTRTDIYGNPRKLYSGVTDKFHLDVTPRLELIDAVDADGDGRGELLFRESTEAGGGYVLYRAGADKLWKLFDSLGE
jgi:hypothetical protein